MYNLKKNLARLVENWQFVST